MKRSIAIVAVLFIIAAAACSDPDSNNGNDNNGQDVGVDTVQDAENDADASANELTVASVQPASGPSTGGTDVVISGTGFDEVDSVSFGGTAATNVNRVSGFQVEATTPEVGQTGLVDVTVTLTSGDSATLTDGYEYTESQTQLEIGYCVLQFPESTSTAPDTETEAIFGRVYVENCSEGDQECDQVTAELGWGPTDADPTASPGDFTWEGASYNPDYTETDNDEYQATITPDSPGDFAYAYRFKVADGDWTYCDLDGSTNAFSTDQMGTLSVEETTQQSVDFCTIQFPDSTTTAPGVATEEMFGRAFVQGCTTGDQECTDLEGELGVGDPGADPSTRPSEYDWVTASYNPGHTSDDNDEFGASLIVPDAGDYSYVYRFRVSGASSWTYCDTDGTDNGFSTDMMGALSVATVTVDWCNLQFPDSIDATTGDTNTVYGQAYVDGCTDGGNDCMPLTAQLGVAPDGSDPTADASAYTWLDATRNTGFSGASNDEFQADLSASNPGDFVYTYRISGDGGQSWTYCDTDGTDNGFQAAQQGTMTVSSP